MRALAFPVLTERAVLWSHAAFWLATAGVLASTAFILATDSEPERVRWWLVFAPLAISVAPLLVPRRDVRIGAAVAIAAWCAVASFSIGFFLWPALAAHIVAANRKSQ